MQHEFVSELACGSLMLQCRDNFLKPPLDRFDAQCGSVLLPVDKVEVGRFRRGGRRQPHGEARRYQWRHQWQWAEDGADPGLGHLQRRQQAVARQTEFRQLDRGVSLREPVLPEARDIIELDQREPGDVALRFYGPVSCAEFLARQRSQFRAEDAMCVQAAFDRYSNLNRGVDTLGVEIDTGVARLDAHLKRRIYRL